MGIVYRLCLLMKRNSIKISLREKIYSLTTQKSRNKAGLSLALFKDSDISPKWEVF